MAAADFNWLTGTLPVFSALAGFYLAGINDARKDRRADRREREARANAAIEKWAESRQEFQRDTLLAVQDELYRVMRCVGKIEAIDRKSVEATGKTTRLPEELDSAFTDTMTTVDRLRVRIFDSDLRTAIEEVQTRAIRCARESFRSAKPVNAMTAADALDKAWKELEPRLGTAILAQFERPMSDRTHAIESNSLETSGVAQRKPTA